MCITFIQRRPNVYDVGPTLCKCYTHVLCLLGLRQEQEEMLLLIKQNLRSPAGSTMVKTAPRWTWLRQLTLTLTQTNDLVRITI